ncbi:MAG: YafY family transcriptional regulator [Kordiimonadaceae bacterium]|nr:YafY family transcriptional regulator [Kordiimonadaceae bacterium]
MRRSDRLFQIVNYLQGRRIAVTASDIAHEFDVSVRTVYRDIQDLILTGVPISGEAGVGYLMARNHCLPPMTLEVGELETLMLGAAMVNSWTDATMAKSARSLVNKLKSVLSDKDRDIFAGTALFAPYSTMQIPWTVDFSAMRTAIRDKRKVKLNYADEKGDLTNRTIRPLSLSFFGPTWLLLGWCELRKDHRHFRLDRIQEAETLEDVFIDTPETSLRHYLQRHGYKDGLHD